MILTNHYTIWPSIPKTLFIKRCRVEIMTFSFVLFHRDQFLISTAFSVSDSLLHICSTFLSCHNVLILLSLSGVTNLSLLVGVCAACMLAYRCLQMKWCAAVMVVAIPSQKALLMCPYVSSGKFPVLAPHCSRALLHNTAYNWSLFDFCKPFGYRNNPCNCHHFSPFVSPRDARVVQILP